MKRIILGGEMNLLGETSVSRVSLYRRTRDKCPEQQPNRRLEWYLQQVQCLQAANQRLERQIQEELDRHCSTELDRHLRTTSLLQDQITQCLSARALVKLQLLGAELTVFDFSSRCEKVREQRRCLEAGLSDLRRLDEELRLRELPALKSLLSDRSLELTALQIKHRQDMHGLQAQMSGRVVVDVRTDASSDLLQCLNDLRRSSAMLLEKNQDERRFSTQVLRSLEVTLDPPHVVQAKLVELRRTASNLEEELTRLQSLNTLLKGSCRERTETIVLQLDVLQQKADGLRRQLESVLQAADDQVLLDAKNKLEAEIQDYESLLDGLSPERVFFFNSGTSPSFSPHRASRVRGGHLQTVPEGLTRILVTKTTNKSPQGTSHRNDLTGHVRIVEFSSIQRNAATTGNTQIVPGRETEIKSAAQFVTLATTSEPSPVTGTQMDHPSTRPEGPGPAPVKLKTPTEIVEVNLKPCEVSSGSHSERSETPHDEVSGDKHVERQEEEEDKERLGVEAEKLSFVQRTSSSCNHSNNNLTSAQMFQLIELETGLRKSVDSARDSQEENMAPIEFTLSQSASTMSTSLFPVDLEDHSKSPDLLLSPADTRGRLSPNVEGDKDEDACLSLTEANPHVRPVEKYTLWTPEDGLLTSFRRERTAPEEGRPRGVATSEDVGESLTFRSFTGKERSKHARGPNMDSEPTRKESDRQPSSRLGSFDFRGSGGRRLGDEEQRVCFEGVYHESIRYKYNENENVQSPGGCSNSGVCGAAANRSEAAAAERTPGRVRHGSGERKLYCSGVVDTRMSIPRTGSEESPSLAKGSVTSQPETGRFAGRGSGEWMVYGGRCRSTVDASASLESEGNKESPSADPMTNPEGTGRFGSRGSGEWRVYGGASGRVSRPARSYSLSNTESVENQSAAAQLAPIPPPAGAGGRFDSAGSGEWRVYGGSAPRLSRAAGADRVSANEVQGKSLLSSGPGLSGAGSGGRLSRSSVVRRSRSVGSGDGLSSSPAGHGLSCSGRVVYTGTGDWKPVSSSASGRRSSVGSAGRSEGGRATGSQRAPSPAGRMKMGGGSGGRLTSSVGGIRVSATGSGSKLFDVGINERVSGSSGSGRTNSTGGRIISSSDRPIGNTSTGAGGRKERISVCKMAALSISAAGRERSQDRERRAHRRIPPPTAAETPLIQRWLTTSTDDIVPL